MKKKKSKNIYAKWDGSKFKLSTSYISAIENLLKEEILMMRKVHKDCDDCWTCGSAKIGDLSKSNGLDLTFSGDESKDYVKKQG